MTNISAYDLLYILKSSDYITLTLYHDPGPAFQKNIINYFESTNKIIGVESFNKAVFLLTVERKSEIITTGFISQ